jgi:hypothetical protein
MDMVSEVAITPAAKLLLDALGSQSDEIAVLSAICSSDDDDLRLVQASLVIGPVAMGNTDWSGWGTAHGLRIVPDVGRPKYLLRAEGFIGVREPMSISYAELWLDAVITTGRLPATGIAPVALALLISAAAPIFISPHLDTPSSSHVTRSVRPGRGVLYPIIQVGEREYPQNWTDDQGEARYGGGFLLGLHRGQADVPRGLVVMRLASTAWINDLRADSSGRTYSIHLGHDPARIDVGELELTFEERLGGELVHARRVRLDQVPSDEVRGAPAFNVDVPSTGHGLQRNVTLYDHTGSVLDMTASHFSVEKINITIDVMGASPGSGRTSSIDFVHDEDNEDRFPRVIAAAAAWEDWLKLGVDQTVFKPGDDVDAVVRQRVSAARGELAIADRYFGTGPGDWHIVDDVSCPIRVVVSLGAAPEPPRADVEVRWLRAKALTLHGRYYLWELGGIYVDNSPAGFPSGFTTVTRIDPFASSRLREIFDSDWWARSKPNPPSHPDLKDRWDEQIRRLNKRLKPLRGRLKHVRNQLRGNIARRRLRLKRKRT